VQVELRHLQVVLSVAEAGSISRAAAGLRIAQSGLTAQLHRIEQELGGPLFVRTTAGVALTDLGEHVTTRARSLLGQFHDLLETSRRLSDNERPASPVVVCGPLGPVVAMVADSVREVLPNRDQVTELERTFDGLTEKLRSDQFDIAVLPELAEHSPRLPPGVRVLPLVQEPAFVAMATSHPLANHGELRLAQLAGQEWVMPDEKLSGLAPSLRLACEEAGFTPRYRHTGADLATALMLIRSGHTVAACYPTAIHSPDVVLRPLAGTPLRRRLALTWRRSSPVHEVIDHIRAKVLKGYQSLIDEHPAYTAWWSAKGDS